MPNDKYELLKDKTVVVDGKTLYRLKAKVPLGNVMVGDLGGYIESEANLSTTGFAWVYEEAKVFGEARVFDDAWVSEEALVFGNAEVFGNSWVHGRAKVSGNASIYGNGWVSGDAEVSGNAWVSGDAHVSDKLKVTSGFYFGTLVKGEKLKKTKMADGSILLSK